jgi:hypothetical protein
MANGQFMLFTRETYFGVGTHQCVQNEVLEDTAMAQIVKNLGHKCEVFFANGALVCRMYDTWPAFVKGWQRLYIELANRRPGRMAKHSVTALVTGCLFPLLSVVALVAGLLVSADPSIVWYGRAAAVAGAAGAVAFYGCLVLGAIWGGASVLGVLLYPLGSALVAWIIAGARAELIRGVPVRWGGKEYLRKPRYASDTKPIRPRGTPHEVPPKGAWAANVVIRPLTDAPRVSSST